LTPMIHNILKGVCQMGILVTGIVIFFLYFIIAGIFKLMGLFE